VSGASVNADRKNTAARGKLFVIAAPSGAGKTSLVRALMQREPSLGFSISCTTRKQRPTEVHGEDYFFVDTPEFMRMVEADEFLEFAKVFDNHYGTPRRPVEEALDAGGNLILEIDWQGAQQVRRVMPESVSIFVLPPTVSEATYRARIFTPAHELPFAGHPSVGAAVTQLRRGLIKAGEVVMECGAGLLPIQVDDAGRATVTGATPTLGAELDPGDLLAGVGLTGDDYRGPAPRWAGCGVEFPFLHVTAEAVARAVTPPPQIVDTICVFAWDAERRESHARVMSPGHGVAEDPATGSAALAFGVWLVGSGLLPGDGLTKYTVRQGLEIHRPSTLDCTVTAVGGKAVQATVTGHVVPIASGEIVIPPFVG